VHALLDTERQQHGMKEAITLFDGLVVDDVGELFPVLVAAGRDGLHALIACHNNLGLRRIASLRERVDAGLRERIHGTLRVSVLDEASDEVHDTVGA
jgi:hypothetical protein